LAKTRLARFLSFTNHLLSCHLERFGLKTFNAQPPARGCALRNAVNNGVNETGWPSLGLVAVRKDRE